MLALGGAAALVALVFAVRYVVYARSHEWTDDAFIDGDTVPVSPKVAGYVKAVGVTDNQQVKAGTLLVSIDPRDFEVARSHAEAAVRLAQAERDKAAADARRARELFGREEVSKQELDHAEADTQVADAKLSQAAAALERAKLDLEYATIEAAIDGRVTKKSVEPGQYVQVGQPLLTLVSTAVWVSANFKESQLNEMRVGQPVEIRVDAYPGREFRGHVDSIQAGTGARFSLFPPENATGNFVKVVQRVPVKIVFDEHPADILLAPGMSVEPSVLVK
jgi:membrane fusion protein (multidrug efflux system)